MPPTRIRATCPGCGEVELTPPDVELRVCREEEHGPYAFVCPECYQTVTKPADRRVMPLLTSGGVPGSRRRAAEAPDPVGSGGPLPQRPEVALPLWLAILLGVFWLAVLVTVAFTVWRMVANLKTLAASVQSLSERLTPELDRLSEASQQAADHAARLSERGARAAGQDG